MHTEVDQLSPSDFCILSRADDAVVGLYSIVDPTLPPPVDQIVAFPSILLPPPEFSIVADEEGVYEITINDKFVRADESGTVVLAFRNPPAQKWVITHRKDHGEDVVTIVKFGTDDAWTDPYTPSGGEQLNRQIRLERLECVSSDGVQAFRPNQLFKLVRDPPQLPHHA